MLLIGVRPTMGDVVGTVSVVIPARNNAADLPAAVASALMHDDVSEVILCVGPSADDTHGVAQSLTEQDVRVVLVENEDGGIPQALNQGLARAQGELLMRVDAHSFVPSGYVRQALSTIEATGAANVGAVQNPVGQTTVERGVAAAMASRFGSGGAAYRIGSELRQVDTAFLGFFRTAALRQIGGWDEHFARNEDAELNARLIKAGHEVWLDPLLQVEYRPRSSLLALAKQYWQYGIWRLRMVRKHPSFLRPRQLAAPIVVTALAASLLAITRWGAWALLVPALYLATVLAVALQMRVSAAERVVAAAALVTMHVSWGSAFLVSAVQSAFRRSGGQT